MIRKLAKYILIYIITVACLTGALVLAAKIPQSAIRENVRESAKYYCDTGLFTEKIEGVSSSTIDHYADSILVGIAYQYDENDPLTSVMWSSYYNTYEENVNVNLLRAVDENLEANQQYLRYWHGSNAIIRPLLTCFNVKQIYIINAVVIVLLTVALLSLLILKKAYTPAVAIILGFVAVSVWMVPTTFEYTWNFIIMLVMSIIGICLAYKDKWKNMGIFFMVGGIVTNYLDFLSTETITLTVPLLLILWIRNKRCVDRTRKAIFVFAGKNTLAWVTGYVGMWISKWIVSSVVLSENTFKYVSEHIGERLGGNLGLNQAEYISGAVIRNVECLFPFNYGVTGVFAGAVVIILAAYVGYVYYNKDVDRKYLLAYVAIAIVPYIRYMVLRNHAYIHCFFTYRAQIATVMAVVFVLELLTDRRWHVGRRWSKR